MQSLEKLLLPVDFSGRSVGAARYARMLAGHAHCEVIVLHVVTPLQFQLSPVDLAGVTIPELYRSQTESMQQELQSLRDTELRGVVARTVLLEGDPASRIVEFASREGVGLILMPTHGYGHFRRFILGSNTAKVLHDADCPVWTGVHMAEAPSGELDVRRVLCAVDLGPQSFQALTWAAWLSSLLEASLTVVHITSAIPESGNHAEEAWRANLRWSAEKELSRIINECGIRADLLVESGEVPQAVCAAATRLKADILVIGRGSAAGIFGRLRTNAYALIRQSPCPVVSV